MPKTLAYTVLIILILCISLRRGGCRGEDGGQPPLAPTPIVVPEIVPEIVPEPIVPKLETNIIYDDYRQSLDLSKIHKRKLIVVFSADWCVYCQDLKKDLKSLKGLDKFIICIIDVDKDKQIPSKFKIKNLPTSVGLNSEEKELSRLVGYRKNKYEAWINSL